MVGRPTGLWGLRVGVILLLVLLVSGLVDLRLLALVGILGSHLSLKALAAHTQRMRWPSLVVAQVGSWPMSPVLDTLILASC